jgi:hypothetical protein
MGTEVVSREVDNFSNSKNLLNINDIDGIGDKYTKVIKLVKGNIPINQNNKKSTVSDNLLAFKDFEKKAILRSPKNIIVNSKQELKNYVLEALNDKTTNKNLYLGVIPNETILRIKDEVTDIKQNKINGFLDNDKHYDLAINQEEIRHLYKESLTVNDVVDFIDSLDELISNFDTVRYTVYNNNQNALRFKKEMQDGSHIALEVISKQKGTFRTQTLFLEKADFITKKEYFSNA